MSEVVRHPLVWNPGAVAPGSEAEVLCKAWLDLEAVLTSTAPAQHAQVIIASANKHVQQTAAALVIGMLHKPDQCAALFALAQAAQLVKFVFEAAARLIPTHMHRWIVSGRNQSCWLIDAALRSNNAPAALSLLHQSLRWLTSPGDACTVRGLSYVHAWLALIEHHIKWVQQVPEVAAHCGFAASATGALASKALRRAVGRTSLQGQSKLRANEVAGLSERSARIVAAAWTSQNAVLRKLGRDGLFNMSACCSAATGSPVPQALSSLAPTMLSERSSRRFHQERIAPPLERRLGAFLSTGVGDDEKAWTELYQFMGLTAQTPPAAVQSTVELDAAVAAQGHIAAVHDVIRWTCTVAVDSATHADARARLLQRFIDAMASDRAALHIVVAAALDWLGGAPKDDASKSALLPLANCLCTALKSCSSRACSLLNLLCSVPSAAAPYMFVPAPQLRSALRAAATSLAAEELLPCGPDQIPRDQTPEVQAAWARAFSASEPSARATTRTASLTNTHAIPEVASHASPQAAAAVDSSATDKVPTAQLSACDWLSVFVGPSSDIDRHRGIQAVHAGLRTSWSRATLKAACDSLVATPLDSPPAVSAACGKANEVLRELVLSSEQKPERISIEGATSADVAGSIMAVQQGRQQCSTLIASITTAALIALTDSAAPIVTRAGRICQLLAPAWCITSATNAWCAQEVWHDLCTGTATPHTVQVLSMLPSTVQLAWLLVSSLIKSSEMLPASVSFPIAWDTVSDDSVHPLVCCVARSMLCGLDSGMLGMLLLGSSDPQHLRCAAVVSSSKSSADVDAMDDEPSAVAAAACPIIGRPSQGVDCVGMSTDRDRVGASRTLMVCQKLQAFIFDVLHCEDSPTATNEVYYVPALWGASLQAMLRC